LGAGGPPPAIEKDDGDVAGPGRVTGLELLDRSHVEVDGVGMALERRVASSGVSCGIVMAADER
jgi:hypothetical protein